MSRIPEDIIQRAGELGNKLAGSRLSVEIARLYSQQTRIRAGQLGLRSWRDDEALKRIKDAELLTEGALLKRAAGGENSWVNDFRRAAEIYEWLSVPGLIVTQHIPTALLSAALYQLSGFPARAKGVLSSSNITESYSAIIRAFLTADFKRLQIEISKFWEGTLDSASFKDPYLESQLEKTIVE